MKLAYEYSREDLNALGFPVMVEGWEKKSFGRVRREYLKEFSYYERQVLSQYYKRFYYWYLVKGTPERFIFRKIRTIALLERAINFFGSI
jgi:hypothetical protein